MPASYDFSDSVALVTGAGGDIGRTTAVRLAASGAKVAITDLDRAAEALERTRAACAEASTAGQVLAVAADVTDPASVAGMLRRRDRAFRRP